jgi:hypothetical protein
MGKHLAAIQVENPNQLKIYLKLLKALEFVQQVSVAAPKLSILVLYSRIFTTRLQRHTINITAGAIIGTWASAAITAFFICRPFAYSWDKSIQNGRCGDLLDTYKGLCIPNIVTDLIMLILPMPALLKLRVKTSIKIGLIITFLTGSL